MGRGQRGVVVNAHIPQHEGQRDLRVVGVRKSDVELDRHTGDLSYDVTHLRIIYNSFNSVPKIIHLGSLKSS